MIINFISKHSPLSPSCAKQQLFVAAGATSAFGHPVATTIIVIVTILLLMRSIDAAPKLPVITLSIHYYINSNSIETTTVSTRCAVNQWHSGSNSSSAGSRRGDQQNQCQGDEEHHQKREYTSSLACLQPKRRTRDGNEGSIDHVPKAFM